METMIHRGFLIWALFLLAACSPAPKREAAKPVPIEPVKIVSFYPAEPVVAPDAPATLCYGVENAASVRLTPPVEAVWPAMSRCFTVNPRVATKFTLTAVGKDGKEVSWTTELKVGKKRAAEAAAATNGGLQILFLLAPSPEIPAGFPATLCYGVSGATKVTMDPDVGPIEPKEKFCATVKPEKTTTYTLIAADASGKSVRQSLTIRVK